MISKNNQKLYDVIISGLGPTGLILGHQLAIRGHKILILEKEPNFYGNARAVYTDDECLRVFQSFGEAEALQEKMLLDTPVQLVSSDGTILVSIKDTNQKFGWPVFNFFYQPYLETHLTEKLFAYKNVEIRRGREVIGFSQSESEVIVRHNKTKSFRFTEESDEKTLLNEDSDETSDIGKYFIACDGGRSFVRTELGIEMTGKNFPEPWLVVDLLQKDPDIGLHHIPYFSFYCDPDCPTVSCPQPDGYHRFEFMLQKGQTKEYMERPSTVKQYLSKYVNPDHFEVKRKLVYTFNALVAREWRKGRVFLAGDAAHMTPQFIGQGMSAGVRDANNLAWKLDLVLRGLANDELLNTYESERIDHVKEMIELAVFLKDLVSLSHPLGAIVRNSILTGVSQSPMIGDLLNKGKIKPNPVYTNGKYFGLPRQLIRGVEGSLSPQPHVRTFKGKNVRLDDLLGIGFSVIGMGVNPLEFLKDDTVSELKEIGFSFVILYEHGSRPQGRNISATQVKSITEVEDIHGLMITWFKDTIVGKNPIAILRPDRYTYGLVKPIDLNEVLSQFILDLKEKVLV
ncbi:MAG: bifunctional 3-(3-hydroxy-phenyl)propionate/3-hydroxycinnamic acid hydroxylase [Spirochaetia bacterium]|nr:bifunctional 3-(3-hydroxy-phenyl)propionate/3-hydroxycinnamic acid hydroxylase [Spirochaetia bacterium]